MISTAIEVVKMPDSIIPLEVTLVIEKFSDIVLKDFLYKLPSMCDTQYTTESIQKNSSTMWMRTWVVTSMTIMKVKMYTATISWDL